ncbi:hypothetical protein PIROE2DRAFT_17907 [Piromyces sp. E2]|nr:hypothetical protein PIROE2DRAFT_17907 [Piromyces sp. E2]|eukprot:OUM57178.1 hypothetical protein PIROE2DRAFT_17907 [Piromyces sp. E2]
MSRGELLVKLCRFYSHSQSISRKVSSIRTNGGYLIDENPFKTIFAVEDPFIHERNTTANPWDEEKIHIFNEFSRAYHFLKNPNNRFEDLFGDWIDNTKLNKIILNSIDDKLYNN